MVKSVLQNKGKKLIITDNVSGVNKLVRAYSTNKTIYGTRVVSISQLATELFLSYAAIYGADKNYRLIDESMRSMRMTAVLKKSDVSFLTQETKTISSANEILSTLNQIRQNTPSEYFIHSDKNCKRIFELKLILDAYEKELKDHNELDFVMVLQGAIKLLQLAKEKPDAKVFLGILSVDLNADVIAGIFTENLSDLEQKFMDYLCQIIGEKYKKIEVFNQGNYEYKFFKSYGIANEVKHIKDIIVSEKLPFGDLAIMYPNEAYEHFLMAEFDEAGMKYTFPRGFRAQACDYVSFLLDLVDFAAGDFEYKRLHNIIQNPIIRIKNARTAYRLFLEEGIGYGRDRYLTFFKYFSSMPSEEKIKGEEYAPFYQFLVDLMNCFNPQNSCEVIFRDLMKLSKKYTDHEDLYRSCLKEELSAYANALSIWEGNDFAEKLFQIESYLKKMKCKTSESADAVSILPYGKTEIIDRKYIFAVGLSNENISTPNAESPVLCDVDLKKCVDGNAKLAMERNRRSQDAFLNTLHLSMQENVYLSYSYYDTVSIIANTPALLFRQLLEKSGLEEKEIESFGYEVCKDTIELKKPVMQEVAALEQKKSVTQTVTEADNANMNESNSHEQDDSRKYKRFSASSLQSLIHCPMNYYYDKVRRIPQINFQERNPDHWLPADVKGNVFHHVMEKYVNEVIISQGKTVKDEQILIALFEKEIEDCLLYTPISSEATFEAEKEECLEVLQRYVGELHEELTGTPNKKVIGCEVAFEEISYKGIIEKDGKTEEAYELLLRGSVDRLDGIMEEDGTLKLQIYDYKTGSFSKKEGEIAGGNQIQHHIYAIAMNEWVKEHKKELELQFGRAIHKIIFDDVRYIFPYEADHRELKAVCELDEESGKPVLPEGTHNILQYIVTNYQKGNQELAITISSEISKELKMQDKNLCRYCTYTDVCRACI